MQKVWPGQWIEHADGVSAQVDRRLPREDAAMARRILMMISNANVSIREVYTVVVQNDLPGWGVSYMSGLPDNPLSILAAFDVLIWELGQADAPDRLLALRTLARQLHEVGARTIIVSHVEAHSESAVDELANLRVMRGPLSWVAIGETLRTLLPAVVPPQPARTSGGRFSRLFRRSRDGEP